MPDPQPGDEIVRELLRRYPVAIGQSSPSKAYHVLMELQHVIREGVPGNVVELGCFEGETTMLIRRLLDELNETRRELHVYDSWEGVPSPAPQDDTVSGIPGFEKGMCCAQLATFTNNFEQSGLRLPFVHSGWFGEIPDVEYPAPIAFAFFDGDMYVSITDSFTKVYPKLAARARVVIDDYEWERLPGVKQACADFLRDKPEKQIALPNYFGPQLGGGAVLIKSFAGDLATLERQ